MSAAILIVAFAIVALTTLALLFTSGVGKELFGRFQIRHGAPTLAEASPEWIDNHDFWDGDIEEVAF